MRLQDRGSNCAQTQADVFVISCRRQDGLKHTHHIIFLKKKIVRGKWKMVFKEEIL